MLESYVAVENDWRKVSYHAPPEVSFVLVFIFRIAKMVNNRAERNVGRRKVLSLGGKCCRQSNDGEDIC